MILDHDNKTIEHAMQSLAGLNKADLNKDVNEACETHRHARTHARTRHTRHTHNRVPWELTARVLLVFFAQVMVHSLLRPMPRTEKITFSPKMGWLWGEKRETVR
jgi:hypothetical protein